MENKRVLIIDQDSATIQWLQRLLADRGYDVISAQTGDQGVKRADIEQPDLVILDLNLADLPGVQVVEAVQRIIDVDRIPIIVFSSQEDLLQISRLFQMGISDFVIKRAGVENELVEKMSTSLMRANSPDGLKQKGKLISFFSAKGGNGTSTLCVNLAHSLAEKIKPRSVLVIDLVLPLGSIAIMTGVEHKDSVATLTSEVKPQDTHRLKEYLLPIEDWSVSILPGSESVKDSQKLVPGRIIPILYSLLRAFDFVFVDLGKTLSSISQSVLNYSDAVVVVASPDILTAELTQIALNHLVEIGIREEKFFLILNRAVGLEGLTRMEMERRIGHPVRRTIPYARDNFTLATNHHAPYAVQFPAHSLTMDLSDLAALLEDFASK